MKAMAPKKAMKAVSPKKAPKKAMKAMKAMAPKKAMKAMKLVVYAMKDKTIMLDVEPSDTFAIVTSKIQAKLLHEYGVQCTFKLISVLDDHRTIGEHGFLNGSVLNMANVKMKLAYGPELGQWSEISDVQDVQNLA